jgi:hypothetical protein
LVESTGRIPSKTPLAVQADIEGSCNTRMREGFCLKVPLIMNPLQKSLFNSWIGIYVRLSREKREAPGVNDWAFKGTRNIFIYQPVISAGVSRCITDQIQSLVALNVALSWSVAAWSALSSKAKIFTCKSKFAA